MSPNLTPPESRDCTTINEMMAWYANGTLGVLDRAEVEAHAQTCASCRASLAVERRIVETMRAPRDNVEQSPHAGWQKMVARLDAQEGLGPVDESAADVRVVTAAMSGVSPADAPVSAPTPIRRRVNWPAALGAAVAVQAAAIAVLTVALVRHRPPPPYPANYVTVLDPDPALAARGDGEVVRIRFDSSVDQPGVLGIAAAAAARKVVGPSPENIYTFVFPKEMAANGVLDNKVTALREQPHVLFVDRVILEAQPHRE